jgi:hypothetical protein
MRLIRGYGVDGIRRRIVIALALLVLAAGVPLAVWAGGLSNPGSSGVSRIERTFGGRDWRCNIDGCSGYRLVLTTPTDVPTVDVVVTVTLAYRLGSGESARATFGYATGLQPPIPCCGDEPTTRLRPGAYRLASAGGRTTTTTLTWIQRDLPAAGQVYRLYFHLTPSIDAKAAFTPKAAVVVEAWTAGN